VEDAQDLTQGFFAEFLERNLLSQYDPARSRLRTFLRVCADSFVMNQDKAAQRQKRGGNVAHVALDFEAAEGELRRQVIDPASIPSPESMEEFFEREWIRSLFTHAIEDLRKLCAERKRETTFALFEAYDLDGDPEVSYEKLAQQHGIAATDVTNALSWARREFRRIALERLREICWTHEEFQRGVREKSARENIVKFLSDSALDRLRDTSNVPNLEGTRYALTERLARGGMGVVYAAHDEKLNRRVALKVLDVPDQSGHLARRLLREAQILARLEHPGIVPVHDAGTMQDGRVFYTMKFVEGHRLDKHIESVESVSDRLRLFLRVCDAVAFAHAHGVLHRDLKPANVMVGPFGEVLVLDWGLAKILPESAGAGGDADSEDATTDGDTDTRVTFGTPRFGDTTAHGAVMGTPGYMSPEQERGENQLVNERSDIFALGALLRFVMCSASSSDASPTRARSEIPDKSLAAICAKAAATKPEDRYATVVQLAEDVSRYLDGLPVSARKENFLDRAQRFYRHHSVAILLITAYLLMRVILLLASHRQNPTSP
jgi:predicted Ser/Thr protein kinase